MSIYTRRGDKGRTDLFSGERVAKNSERIEAYGTIDELNAALGRARAMNEQEEIIETIREVQNHLHICQAELANTDNSNNDYPRIKESHTEWLENRIDTFDAELPQLTHFIIQGGTVGAADLFTARAICRRAERRLVHLNESQDVPDELVAYINRLGDLLFTVARLTNVRIDITEQKPEY